MNIVTALDLMLNLLIEAQKIGALITQAQATGRTDLTDAQMSQVINDADTARERLDNAIKAAKAQQA